jgi:hypothetical protein
LKSIPSEENRRGNRTKTVEKAITRLLEISFIMIMRAFTRDLHISAWIILELDVLIGKAIREIGKKVFSFRNERYPTILVSINRTVVISIEPANGQRQQTPLQKCQ